MPHWAAKSWPRWNSPAPPGDGADAVAERRGRDQLVQRRTQAARGGRAGDGAGGLGAQQLLELAVRIALWWTTAVRLKSILAAAAADISGWARQRPSGGPACPVAITGPVAGTVDRQDQARCGEGDSGLLPDAAGGGEFRDLAERTAAATAFIAVRVARALGLCSTPGAAPERDRSRGDGPWWSGWSRTVPLWIACEVSCRIRVREIKDPVRRGRHPGTEASLGIPRWSALAADGLHPKAA